MTSSFIQPIGWLLVVPFWWRHSTCVCLQLDQRSPTRGHPPHLWCCPSIHVAKHHRLFAATLSRDERWAQNNPGWAFGMCWCFGSSIMLAFVRFSLQDVPSIRRHALHLKSAHPVFLSRRRKGPRFRRLGNDRKKTNALVDLVFVSMRRDDVIFKLNSLFSKSIWFISLSRSYGDIS